MEAALLPDESGRADALRRRRVVLRTLLALATGALFCRQASRIFSHEHNFSTPAGLVVVADAPVQVIEREGEVTTGIQRKEQDDLHNHRGNFGNVSEDAQEACKKARWFLTKGTQDAWSAAQKWDDPTICGEAYRRKVFQNMIFRKQDFHHPTKKQNMVGLALPKLQRPNAIPTSSQNNATTREVLVIIDTQNDYCADCEGMTSYEKRRNEAAWGTDLQDIVQNIKRLHKQGPVTYSSPPAPTTESPKVSPSVEAFAWDGLVMSFDTLPHGRVCMEKDAGTWKVINYMNTSEQKACQTKEHPDRFYSLLTAGSRGWPMVDDLAKTILLDVEQRLGDHTGFQTLEIKKQVDNWMDSTGQAKAYRNGADGIGGKLSEEEGIDPSKAIQQMFCETRLNGGAFDCSRTRLWITGIQTTRCVMKGALRALALGFDVMIPKDTTKGGGTDKESLENWPKCLDAKRTNDVVKRIGRKLSWADAVSECFLPDGSSNVSPTLANAWALLEAAGATIVDKANAHHSKTESSRTLRREESGCWSDRLPFCGLK